MFTDLVSSASTEFVLLDLTACGLAACREWRKASSYAECVLEENEGTCVTDVTPWDAQQDVHGKGMSSMHKLVTKSAVGSQKAALPANWQPEMGISAS